MQPHQQRVVDERDELDSKLEKLSHFMGGNPIYLDLPDDEKDRLHRQRGAMEEYSKVLWERIKAFK